MSKEGRKKFIRLSSIDLLGVTFSLKFPTASGNFQTKLGGCLTIITILFLLIAFPAIFSQYLDTSSPIVTTSSTIAPRNTAHNLYRAQMIPPLLFRGIRRGVFVTDVETYFTIKAYSTELQFNNQTLKYDYISVREIEYTLCRNLKDPLFKELINITVGVDVDAKTKFWCPDFKGDLTLADVSKENKETKFKKFIFKVFPCSLEDKSKCRTRELIARSGGFVWRFISRPLASDDYKNPLRMLALFDVYRIDPSTVQHKYLTSKNNKLVDNRNELTGKVLKKEFVTLTKSGEDSMTRDSSVLHCEKKDVKMDGDCPEFYTFEINGGEEEVTILRDYKKLGEMFGELGGLLKLLTGLTVLYTFYNLKTRTNYLTRTILEQKTRRTQLGSAYQGSDFHDVEKGFSSPGILRDDPDSSSKRNQSLRSPSVNSSTIVNQLLKSRVSSENFVQGMNFLDILEDIMTHAPSERILIPLALTKFRQNKIFEPLLRKTQQRTHNPKQENKHLEKENKNHHHDHLPQREQPKSPLGELLSTFLKRKLESGNSHIHQKDDSKKNKFTKKSKLRNFIQKGNDEKKIIQNRDFTLWKAHSKVELEQDQSLGSGSNQQSLQGQMRSRRVISIELGRRQSSNDHRNQKPSKETSSFRVIQRRSEVESKRFSKFRDMKEN